MGTQCEVATSNRLIPQVRLPAFTQGLAFAVCRRAVMRACIGRYGRVFEMNLPLFGRTVVVSDPELVRTLCAVRPERLGNVQPNLSNWFGPGSMFALDGAGHRERRRLLAPVFHGQSLKQHERIIEQETLRESATWPVGDEFPILEPMNRITLNVILRALFGPETVHFDELRAIVPAHMRLGQLMAFVPPPPSWAGRPGPWHRLDRFRDAFDRIVGTLIDRAVADPGFAERTDVLARLLRSGGGGATVLTKTEICDELLTFIGAGHETTATALSWVFERLRRHPGVLAELVAEVDAGGGELRRATIAEVLRVRTVIDVAGRRVQTPGFDLGPWRIPRDHTVLVRIADLHSDPASFPRPERFDPHRFRDGRPAAWLAFGGGPRRCLGAEFAIAEMDVVLRTVLEHFRIHTDDAPDERSAFRGVAHAPSRGGRVVVTRRG